MCLCPGLGHRCLDTDCLANCHLVCAQYMCTGGAPVAEVTTSAGGKPHAQREPVTPSGSRGAIPASLQQPGSFSGFPLFVTCPLNLMWPAPQGSLDRVVGSLV